MFKSEGARYEFSERSVGLAYGGIAAMHGLMQGLSVPDEINSALHLLKVHVPYWESDHVLSIAYNSLCGGTCLDDLERLRNDEAYVRALGADRIPDPTTSGDFCRRFDAAAVESLQDAFNKTRLRVWQQQPKSFFREAVVDVDGTLVETTGECKEGMDISYDGKWGYQTLLVSFANTREPLFLYNRPGNRPSHEGAAHYLDRAVSLCEEAGFERILLRGDTDFSQTTHLDRWDKRGVSFVFGYDANPKLKGIAEELPASAWTPLSRKRKYEVKTSTRAKPERVKEKVIQQREFVNIKLVREHVAEFEYKPRACRQPYRMVVVRKQLKVLKGQQELREEVRHLFYITNDFDMPARSVVKNANDRCEQENLIDQGKNGVCSLRAPLDNLVSNWAYMVMASLAWSIKAWAALVLPETGRWRDKHRTEKWDVVRMEFKQFINEFIRMPALLISTGRQIVLRLLSWSRKQHVFLRLLDVLDHPLLC